MRNGAYMRCGLSLFQVDYGIGQFLCAEMLFDRARAFAGDVFYDKDFHTLLLATEITEITEVKRFLTM
jgi:hypothetical protein